METDSFVFEEQDFQFEKGPDFWQLSLKRSKVELKICNNCNC